MNNFFNIDFYIFNDFLFLHLDEMIKLTYSIHIEKFFEYLFFPELKLDPSSFDKDENFLEYFWSKKLENTMIVFPRPFSTEPDCLVDNNFFQYLILILKTAQTKFFTNLFIINFLIIKLIFFKVNSLNFWILPQIILFIGGLVVFLLIKTNDLNLWIWGLTQKILLFSICYQLLLLYIYLKFFEMGIELKVGLNGLFKVPFNLFLVKLISFLVILLILLLSTYFLRTFYFQTLSLIKPELCSLILFLGFGSGMVFLQNDLFSIFLYLEIISFCVYGFLFLQQRNSSQLHGLIRYILFSLWVASFYILGMSLYLSWTNFNTNLSYYSDNNVFLDSIGLPTYSASVAHGYLNFEITFAILCFLFYFLFKLGATPFYTWVIEVYNSCSTGILLAVSIIPKLIYIPVLFFLLYYNFLMFYAYWSTLLFSLGFLTTVIASVAVLSTDKLKEIYAWSSIIHTGNILMILSCLALTTLPLLYFYLISYVLISIGFISIIVSIRSKGTSWFTKTLSELSSLNYLSSGFLIICLIILSSASGFTPLLSFFMKFSLFTLISHQHGIALGIAVGLVNIIGSVAYLRMLRSMIGFNLNFFSFKKKKKPNVPIVISVTYGFGFFLNVLCLLICLGYFFFTEFIDFFLYPTDSCYPDQENIEVDIIVWEHLR